MLPAAVVDETIDGLASRLGRDDIVIDGGNSYYIDDIRRAKELAARQVHFVDVGTSGGIWGLERGYCMMIGGNTEAIRYLDPILATLAPGKGSIARTPGREKIGGTAEQGYLHCGPSGAGHFVKMVHNGIEYGLMAAYAEGLNVLREANAGKQQQAADAETTPLRDPSTISTTSICTTSRKCGGAPWSPLVTGLDGGCSGRRSGIFKIQRSCLRLGRRTVDDQCAIDEAVPAPVLSRGAL
jgi:6-phosphogluconate dehydrogenase